MILALLLLSEMTLTTDCLVLSGLAEDSSTTRQYWSPCVHSFLQEVCQELHPWLFWAVLTCMTTHFFDACYGETCLYPIHA